MPQDRYYAREAAAALLKMAQMTSDPNIAAALIQIAASLKEQIGELPPPVTHRAPDVREK